MKPYRSIIQEYEPPKSLLSSPSSFTSAQFFSKSNPLASLDYITSDIGAINSVPGSGSSESDQIYVNKTRKIAPAPYNTLVARNLCDDFYLNLVDWSSTNILAVALAQSVLIWNANTSSQCELVDLGEQNRVTSVSWSQKGQYLSVGTHDGQVQIWDVERQRLIRSDPGHNNRVSSCAWSNSLIATGSKDKQIYVRDLRVRNYVK